MKNWPFLVAVFFAATLALLTAQPSVAAIPTTSVDGPGPVVASPECIATGTITTFAGIVYRDGKPILAQRYSTEAVTTAELSADGHSLLVYVWTYVPEGIRRYTVTYSIDWCSKLSTPIASKSTLIWSWTDK